MCSFSLRELSLRTRRPRSAHLPQTLRPGSYREEAPARRVARRSGGAAAPPRSAQDRARRPRRQARATGDQGRPLRCRYAQVRAMKGVLAAAVLVVALMAVIKDGRVMRKTGLSGSCTAV